MLFWLYQGLHLGYLSHQAESITLHLQPHKKPTGEFANTTVKDAAKTVKPLRDRCKNNLHV